MFCKYNSFIFLIQKKYRKFAMSILHFCNSFGYEFIPRRISSIKARPPALTGNGTEA